MKTFATARRCLTTSGSWPALTLVAVLFLLRARAEIERAAP